MKAYVKPQLFVERYELSQHIAACGIDVKNSAAGDCEYLDPGFWVGDDRKVYNDFDNCQVLKEGLYAYCYTDGTTEAGRVFSS